MHPAPEWVTEARRKILKKKRARAAHKEGPDAELDSEDEDSEDDEDIVDDLFRGTGLKKGRGGKGLLKAGEIDIDRVRDANQAEATSVSSFLFLYVVERELTLRCTNLGSYRRNRFSSFGSSTLFDYG